MKTQIALILGVFLFSAVFIGLGSCEEDDDDDTAEDTAEEYDDTEEETDDRDGKALLNTDEDVTEEDDNTEEDDTAENDLTDEEESDFEGVRKRFYPIRRRRSWGAPSIWK